MKLEIKLTLRPMANIEEYFKPLFNNDNPDVIEFLSQEYLADYGINDISDILNFKIEYLPYGLVNLLLKHHFDVFDLIKNGLAIELTN